MSSFVFEVIGCATAFAAEEMGVVLRRTAYSPNIRDRLDYSCAILSPEGDLVAQAEHIPVHLGSMAIGAKNTLRYLEEHGVSLEPGDVVMVNDPYIAGTHLNDITVIKPIYHNGKLVGFAANKAHHVDVGGPSPGSLNAAARELQEEGLVIPPVKVVRRGRLVEDVVKLVESNVRIPRYFRGDLLAQVASLNVGEKRVLELVERYGLEKVWEAWKKSLDYVEQYTRARLAGAKEGAYRARDYVELGEELLNIDVTVTITREKVVVDYTGTHEQVEAPVNAVYGVTVAATTYALKAVLDPDLPMNHGFFRVVEIKAPQGSLVNPLPPAPVGAGNVETSQRIVDVVLRALAEAFPDKVPAASQGTMNNVVLGGVRRSGERWAYYETIAGGSGARPVGDGVDGVHTNMTNTMNTPIEVAEREYPILFLEYSLRRDSGGPGKYRGGLGVTRSFKLLEGRATLSIIASRVRTSPWGLKGGLPGKPGEHYVITRGGEKIVLRNIDRVELEEGDVVVINTPGGGGYGDPRERDPAKIREDLLDEKVSPEAAEAYYGYCG